MEQLQGTKRSKQRDRIFLTLRRTRSHPTAEWIYERVRHDLPKISLGTVYRNLHVLKYQGKIQELDFGEGTRRYDAFTHDHYHFICDECGTVKDLEVPTQPDINDRVKSIVPGVVHSHRLDYFGVCSDCIHKV